MAVEQTRLKPQSFPAPYPQYSAIVDREPLEWPRSARVAIWVCVSIGHCPLGAPETAIYPHLNRQPEIANYGWRDYGNRVGIWRLFEMFDELEIPLTVLMNAEVFDHYPRIVEHVLSRSWCILPHGLNSKSSGHGQLAPDVEKRIIANTLDRFKQSIGRVPHGWMTPNFEVSPETYNLLAKAGVRYTADWCNDDQPYEYATENGPLLHVPYSLECNDYHLGITSKLPGPEIQRAIEDQFEQLWEDGGATGRVMPLALHPFISGQPMRAKYIRRALEQIKSCEQTWITTSDAIYDFMAHRSDETWDDSMDW